MAGRVIMYSWFLIHYTQVLLAINRFMAINCFMTYKKVFSYTNTMKILVVLSIYLLWIIIDAGQEINEKTHISGGAPFK
ncbi:hypothetical protein ANCCEY_11992 [Ancylostoma ceylanicum]|uniref:7TM GPCR serpentine receptor class x (Srx) domain-containing protein n=1 Tax=Ancylostoma ceylanicum TaxID=53326 RepID=A0A0D6LG70_9BILA|nr:hypothetical protein ANCCEY_11992 [Ancylostoma ceylanicum]